jgi:uncharacterized protein YraI
MERGGLSAIAGQWYQVILLGCLALIFSACSSGQPSTATAVLDSTPGGAASDTPSKIVPSPTSAAQSSSGGASSRPVVSPAPVLQATTTSEPEKVPIVKFVRASSETTPPEDVLKEIAIFEPGGGGGGGCGSSQVDDRPSIVVPTEYDRQSEQRRDLGASVFIFTCGWEVGEVVNVTVKSPDGKSTSYQEKQTGSAEYPAGVSHTLNTKPNDPAGVYTVTFEGKRGRLNYSVTYSPPASPKVYREDNKLWLYGFEPNELVRILLYFGPQEDRLNLYDLAGWQEFKVNSGGQLIVETDSAGVHVVLGSTSGYVENSSVLSPNYLEAPYGVDVREGPGYKYGTIAKLAIGARVRVDGEPSAAASQNGWTIWWPIDLDDGRKGWVDEGNVVHLGMHEPVNSACPGAPVSRVKTGMKVRVAFSNGVAIRVRSGPGISANKIKTIPEGTVMSIVDGPVCKDNFEWWNAKFDDGTVGWVAEGEPGNYFIEPWQ